MDALGIEIPPNARLVRNLIERAIRRQAVRLYDKVKVNRDDLMLIVSIDITEAAQEL